MNILLDIVFQSGDFYNEGNSWLMDLLNTIIGAGIGSGVTVWALYKTFNQDKRNEEERRIQFQKQKIKYFQSLIRSILKDLKLQIDYYKTFADKLRENLVDLPLLQQVSLNELEQIVHKLNQEDYYHSYLGEFGNSQEMVDEFRKIISVLNYFDGNIAMYKSSLQKSFDFDYERKVKLKDLVEKSMDDTAGFLINNEVLEKQHDFWNFLNQTMIDFHEKKTEQSDLKFYHDNFVEVIKKGLIDFSRTIPQAHYLIVQMKNATFIYSDIQMQNLNVADDFDQLHNDMKEFYGKFETLSKRLIDYNSN
jgi:hypothetical protein